MSAARARVLHFIKGLGLGGAERLLERAIPYLDRDSYDYHVAYLLPWKNALVPAFEKAGIPVHCLDARRALDVRILAKLSSLLRREAIDLVHAHLPVPSVLTRLVRARSGVRWLVYTEHNVPRRYGLITRTLNAATYRMNDAVIAVSQEVAAQVQPYVRNGHPRLLTITNAVDVEESQDRDASRRRIIQEFGFPADALLVVNVANFVPKKGHLYLLGAARRVLDGEPRTRFLLVGVGPQAEQLKAQAMREGLDGHVVFTGLRQDALALIEASDLFVLPSLYEGLPLSLLEAMALARPAIATRVGGVPEVIVDGESGVLVEPADAEALAAAMLGLLHDPGRRAQLGSAARQQARRRYGMEHMVGRIEQVYHQLAHS